MSESIIPHKRCAQCKQLFPITMFYKAKRYKYGVGSYCVRCIAERRGRVWHPKCLIPDGYRQCGHCGECLTIDNFHKNPNNHLGLQNICRTCKQIADAKWLEKNRDKSRATSKARYYAKPEARKLYHDTHLNEIAQTKRNYRKTHPDAVKKHKRDSTKRFRETQPEKYHMRNRITSMRSRIKEGNAKRSDLVELYDLQDGRCCYCGIPISWSIKHQIHVDHILPITRGGMNDVDNLALTCADCNLSKHDYTLSEWEQVRGW